MRNNVTLLFLTFFSLSASADNIYLKNGDAISGAISIVDSNKILVKTGYAGEIRINLADVKSFNIDTPSLIKNETFSKWESIDSIESGPDGEITLIKEGSKENIALTKDLVLSKNKIEAKTRENKISGGINAGAAYNKGSSTTEKYSLDGNLNISNEDWRQNFTAAMLRNKDNSNVSTYYYNLGYDLDRFITPSFFWRGNVSYQHDWIEDIKEKTGVGTGPGWQVWNDELSSLSFTTILSYQNLKYRHDGNANYLQGALGWDYNQYLFAKKVTAYTKGRVGRSFDNDVSLDFNGRVGVMYNFTDSINLNANIVKEKIKGNKGDSNNTNYTFGVGYRF
ncbi:DUF481 domain-containing protein [Proteus myxofaciens]|uniref:Peptide chain release factor RF-3 n=1 Tax=Proteus myxofaciens ATCC 19692 TaxID=1354337 RepID=A0A198GB94_9GAMM|nr:DUF481 domain-containing protein [Proteus myxofaciens]OAT34702.1 peptide chain release factor RF-3 [Proteus myxofaciens ATCC 19692]